MSEIEIHLASLDAAIWELSEAFSGLPDADVWKRPDPRLLSVGELASHIAYWEAKSFLTEGFDSPLVVEAARYYSSNVTEAFQLALGAQEVFNEVKRIHESSKAAILASGITPNDPSPNREGWTWGYTLAYQAFHVAYHTGQIYSVRHLLGHETVDN